MTQSAMPAESDDALRDRHEIRRQHETAMRVTPANERLRAHQSAVIQRDLRLIEELELVHLDGPHQLVLQAQSRLQLGPDPAIEENVPVAPDDLGPI